MRVGVQEVVGGDEVYALPPVFIGSITRKCQCWVAELFSKFRKRSNTTRFRTPRNGTRNTHRRGAQQQPSLGRAAVSAAAMILNTLRCTRAPNTRIHTFQVGAAVPSGTIEDR